MSRSTILLLAAALLVAAPAEAQRTVERSRAARADGVVEIENIAGSIRVEGWDRNEVAMTARLGRNVEEVEFTGDAGHTKIRVVYPRRGNSGGSDVTVRVPTGSRLKVSGVSAGVAVRQVSGAVDATSVSGDVEIQGSPRSLNAQSVSGDVVLNGSSSDIRATSVSGDIELNGANGFIEAETTSGDMAIQGRDVSSLTAHSVSGEIGFAGSLQQNASVSVESFSGTVDFAVPGGTRGDFEASTFSGSIENRFSNHEVTRQRRGPGASLEFSTGGQGAQVKLKSFSGTIRLRRM